MGKQTKSTMYGLIGACRRNFRPSSCSQRNLDHKRRSVSVGCIRIERA